MTVNGHGTVSSESSRQYLPWLLKNKRILHIYAIFENSLDQQNPRLSQIIVKAATIEILIPNLSCKTYKQIEKLLENLRIAKKFWHFKNFWKKGKKFDFCATDRKAHK